MTRVEHLVQKSLDAGLSDAESEELASILEQGGRDAESALQLYELEGLLRGASTACDVTAAVTSEIQERVQQNTAGQVLSKIAEARARRPFLGTFLVQRPVLQGALAAAAALLICTGLFLLWQRAPVPPDENLQADIRPMEPQQVVPRDGRSPEAGGTPPQVARRELRTGDAPVTTINLEDGSRLDVGSHAVLAIERSDTFVRVVLEKGLVTSNIFEQPPGRSFQVVTPHLLVEVVGTEFTVEYGGDTSKVSVQEGAVHVTSLHDGKRVRLDAGRVLTSSAGGTVVLVK